jgi:hypothetical protein
MGCMFYSLLCIAPFTWFTGLLSTPILARELPNRGRSLKSCQAVPPLVKAGREAFGVVKSSALPDQP